MSTNRSIRDAQMGVGFDDQGSLVASLARSARVTEMDVTKVLERLGLSCEVEQFLSKAPEAHSAILRLDAEKELAWHRHSEVTNTYFCLEGTMIVETKAPDSRLELTAGQTCAVQPKQFHRVVSKDGCRFVVLHGAGNYDVRLTE